LINALWPEETPAVAMTRISGRSAKRTSALSIPSTITIVSSLPNSVSLKVKWSGLPDPTPSGNPKDESQQYRRLFFGAFGRRI
jgi:hypothetical protein